MKVLKVQFSHKDIEYIIKHTRYGDFLDIVSDEIDMADPEHFPINITVDVGDMSEEDYEEIINSEEP